MVCLAVALGDKSCCWELCLGERRQERLPGLLLLLLLLDEEGEGGESRAFADPFLKERAFSSKKTCCPSAGPRKVG